MIVQLIRLLQHPKNIATSTSICITMNKIFVFCTLAVVLFTHAHAACRLVPKHYEVITSGTCQSNGYLPISNFDLCKEAATSVGRSYSWTPGGLSAYQDVVDGCSIRNKRDLFVNRNNACKVGHPTPDWIPLVKGKATCKCSVFQPCVCIPRYELVKEQTCEAFGSSPIYDRASCLSGGKKVVPTKPTSIPDHVNAQEPDGCILFRNMPVWIQKKGTCTLKYRCGCNDEYSCICDRKYLPVYSGTCESNGLNSIFSAEMCEKAFAYFGWSFNWSTPGLSSYGDVVDGCSRRRNGSRFNQRKGGCTTGSCECTKSQPCACALK